VNFPTKRLPITVRLESFEGPLDLLIYLIQSQELDISKVSIKKITDQYLSYIYLMHDLNLDLASEFLVMAATLLHWKSKSLLPNLDADLNFDIENEGDFISEDDLIRQLIEHQRFKQAARDMEQLNFLGDDVFTRQNAQPPTQRIWRETNLSELILCYQETLMGLRKSTKIVAKETVSLTEKIIEMSKKLKIGCPTNMDVLFSSKPSKNETVVTFLASLELAKQEWMRLYQEDTYDPIYLELIKDLDNFKEYFISDFDQISPLKENVPANSLPGIQQNKKQSTEVIYAG